jgi:hypothetical protein
MPRGGAEAAAEAPKLVATVPKVPRTSAAMDNYARVCAERRKQSRAAAEWAHENECGARKACSSGNFGDATYNMVHPLLQELKEGGSIAADRDHAKQILTNTERHKLAAWILKCADGQNPKDRTEVRFCWRRSVWLLRRRMQSTRRLWSARHCFSAARPCALAGSSRARGMGGSGARCAVPRRDYAGSGLA